MRRTLALLAAVLVVVPLTGPAAGSTTEASDRYVIDTETLSPDQLADGLARGEGELVRTDPRLDVAVAALEEPGAFEAETGVEPLPDARGGGGADAVAAEVPEDELYATQWGPTELDMPQAWKLEPGSPDVEVAIVDSGLQADHPDLDDVPTRLGHDYVDDDATPQDAHGHGTHVAGIVTAERSNGEGIAGMADVGLYVTRVFDADNAGWCSDFAAAIVESVDAGADIVNFSGWCSVDFEPLQEAIQYAQDQGVLFVTISGNFQLSNPQACVTYPGQYPTALAVGALDPTLTPASYSCQGPEVELSAPGSQIISALPEDTYGPMSGTSMAAPHVAGTAALLLAEDPSLGDAEIRERLTATARDLGEPGRDPIYGHGMVDPVNALSGTPVFVPGAS